MRRSWANGRALGAAATCVPFNVAVGHAWGIGPCSRAASALDGRDVPFLRSPSVLRVVPQPNINRAAAGSRRHSRGSSVPLTSTPSLLFPPPHP